MAIKLPTYEEYQARVRASQPVVDLTEKEEPTTPSYVTEDAIAIDAPTTSDILSYGWNVKGVTDMNKLAKIGRIKGWLDVGKFDEGQYKSVQELYGEDFFDLSESERRNRINTVDQQQQEADYLGVMAYGEDNSLLAGATGLVGSLATPTTLIPGVGFAKSGAIGLGITSALFGAEYDLLQQYADKGDIDLEQFLTTTALAGGAGLGLGFAGEKLVKLIRGGAAGATATGMRKVTAQTKADKIQDMYYKAVEQDVPLKDIEKFARDELNMTPEEFVDTIAAASNKPVIPKSKAEAIEARKLAQADVNAESIKGDATVNKYITPIIEGIGKIDQKLGLNNKLKNKVNGYFFHSYNSAIEKIKASKPLEDAYKKLPKHAQDEFDNLLLNANKRTINSARDLLEKYVPGSKKAFDDYKAQIKNMSDELASYYDIPDNPFYVPRVVADFAGLNKYLNKNPDVQGVVEKALDARAKELKINKSELSNADKEFITSSILRGLRVGTNAKTKKLYATKRSKNAKRETFLSAKKIQLVNKEMQKYYAKPLDGTYKYFLDAQKLVEKNKFFDSVGSKKHAKQITKGKYGLDFDKSRSSLMSELADAGMDSNTEVRLKSMLEALFVDADKSMSSGWAHRYKNIVNASLLANPLSALTQIADVSMSAWKLGIRNTIEGLIGKEVDIVKDLNIDQLIMENFSSGIDIARGVDKLLGYSGFKKMDRLGKTAIVNAAFKRAQKMAATPEGRAKLKKQYGSAYEEKFDIFIDDLQNKRITSLTKEYLFNELAEFQPITPAQMPEAYLKADNGRLMWTLQSFTLKQLNLIRKQIVDEFRYGSKKEAIKNAASFALLIPPSNMAIEYGKERILGKDPDLKDELVQRYVNNALKVFGSSEFAVSQFGKSYKIGDFLLDSFAPPLEILDGILKTGGKAIVEGEFDDAVVKDIPVVGRLIYYYFGSGLEKWQDRQDREESKERRERFGV
jgi:ribosomal protein L9